MAAVRKTWVKKILSNRAAYEKAIGMPLGEVLGCGHYGCVVASTDPWVVKLTIDPNEPYLWERAILHLDESGYGSMGIVRIKDVVQLNPKVDGKQVFAIVRESVAPVMTDGWFSDYTKSRYVGSLKRWSLYDKSLTYEEEKFSYALHQLQNYKIAASALMPQDPSSSKRGKGLTGWYGFGDIPDPYRTDLMRSVRLMQSRGSLSMQEIAVAMECWLNYGFVLRDVHDGNIGWRIHERVPGFDEELPTDRVVIYDLGHTRVVRASERMRSVMVENPLESWEWYSDGVR